MVAPIIGSGAHKLSQHLYPHRFRPALALDEPILNLARLRLPSQYVDPAVARRAAMQSMEAKNLKQSRDVFFELKPLRTTGARNLGNNFIEQQRDSRFAPIDPRSFTFSALMRADKGKSWRQMEPVVLC